MDTVMLEKIKQARASNFKGFDIAPGAPTPQKFIEPEKEISKRYSPEELKKLKQHGFTGMNVEQRAKRFGLSDVYNICYRNFSRNVHSTDFMELILQEYPGLISRDHDAYLEERNAVCCILAFISIAGISDGVNNLARLGLDKRFNALTKARERMSKATSPR